MHMAGIACTHAKRLMHVRCKWKLYLATVLPAPALYKPDLDPSTIYFSVHAHQLMEASLPLTLTLDY